MRCVLDSCALADKGIVAPRARVRNPPGAVVGRARPSGAGAFEECRDVDPAGGPVTGQRPSHKAASTAPWRWASLAPWAATVVV
ncbi:hypothetical protein GCM10023324_02170 [Streptomyces youssoufiensis]